MTQQVYAIWTLLENENWTSSSYEIVNECDLCDEQGMLHRPDRVLINGDAGIVIDFKTGKQDEKYHHKVKEYCRLLEATGIWRGPGRRIESGNGTGGLDRGFGGSSPSGQGGHATGQPKNCRVAGRALEPTFPRLG